MVGCGKTLSAEVLLACSTPVPESKDTNSLVMSFSMLTPLWALACYSILDSMCCQHADLLTRQDLT